MTSQGVPSNEASAQAYYLMSRTIAGQASTLAYVDIISFGPSPYSVSRRLRS